MEVVGREINRLHLSIRDFDAGGIGVLVEFAADRETGGGGRCGDQLDNNLVADERFSAPVGGDERGKAVSFAFECLCPTETHGSSDARVGVKGKYRISEA